MNESLPYLLPYAGVAPKFAGCPVHAGSGAAVLGRATLGRDAWLGQRSAIRADGHYVRIGDNFRLGPRSTVHIAHDVLPAVIGSNVTAGTNTVIHACTVGDNCHFGDGVVILDGAKIADECAIADGSIVFPRSTLEGGWLYDGLPAKPVRRLEPGELDKLQAALRARADETAAQPSEPARIERFGALFVASTAHVSGHIIAGGENGIWFGCDLDAAQHQISIGANTNIQDNTVIRCVDRAVEIGRDATIGHNVLMTDCSVGDRALIGIGAIVAPGTMIGDDVLLAAGAHTTPAQVLESGWLYGGRPARKLSQLDDEKREMIASIWPTYCEYARRFHAAQDELSSSQKDSQG